MSEKLNYFSMFRTRYYDPGTGRFVSSDPISFRGGDTNEYRYVFNNPARYNDPSGKIVWAPIIIGGIVGGVYSAATGGDTGDIIIGTIVGGATAGTSVFVQIFADLITSPSDLDPNDILPRPPGPSCNPSVQSCPNPIPSLPSDPNQCTGGNK